jgi:hypothetical protein
VQLNFDFNSQIIEEGHFLALNYSLLDELFVFVQLFHLLLFLLIELQSAFKSVLDQHD